jgi:hypothetical protein
MREPFHRSSIVSFDDDQMAKANIENPGEPPAKWKFARAGHSLIEWRKDIWSPVLRALLEATWPAPRSSTVTA